MASWGYDYNIECENGGISGRAIVEAATEEEAREKALRFLHPDATIGNVWFIEDSPYEDEDWWLNGVRVTKEEIDEEFDKGTPGLYGYGLDGFLPDRRSREFDSFTGTFETPRDEDRKDS